MPLIRLLPRAVVDRYIELERDHDKSDFAAGRANGFFEAVHMLHPDGCGMMVMDKDCELELHCERISDTLPRIVVDDDNTRPARGGGG